VRIALQDTIGCYCSICEMPVYVSDAVTGKGSCAAGAAATLADWEHLLLACEFCQAHRAQDVVDVSACLWPDTDATFSLDDRSPFVHELRQVALVLTDDAANVVHRSSTSLGLIVANASSPDAARAQRTLDLFQLNSPHYDAATNTYALPLSARGSDRRIELRTEAWGIVLRTIDTLNEARAMTEAPAYYEGLVKLVAGLAQFTGFWSVWMSALWSAFHDRDLIRNVLLEISDRRGYVVTGFQTHPDGGKAPWSIFTGTAIGRISF
jgi:hypothetical protein